MKDLFLKDQQFTADFIGGGLSGAFTGTIVAPVEALKIEFQMKPNLGAATILRDPKTRKNMLKAIQPFATIFSVVCALEFSVNERIKERHGDLAGVAASALTGSAFLTVADHLMFKRQFNENTTTAFKNLLKIRFTAPWTGFVPMVAREAIFITSVMHLGPAIGKRLQHGENTNSLYWNTVGRLLTGFSTTLLSQPFDVLARDLQMQRHQNPTQQPSMLQSFNNMRQKMGTGSHWDAVKRNRHPLFCGALPRMGLATFGGVLAGGFFQQFRDSICNEHVASDEMNETKNPNLTFKRG